MAEPQSQRDALFVVYAHSRPGVLAKLAGVFYRRGLDIRTLTVGATHEPELAKIVLRVAAAEAELQRIAAAIGNQVDVLRVEVADLDGRGAQELCLVRVAARGAERDAVRAAVRPSVRLCAMEKRTAWSSKWSARRHGSSSFWPPRPLHRARHQPHRTDDVAGFRLAEPARGVISAGHVCGPEVSMTTFDDIWTHGVDQARESLRERNPDAAALARRIRQPSFPAALALLADPHRPLRAAGRSSCAPPPRRPPIRTRRGRPVSAPATSRRSWASCSCAERRPPTLAARTLR
jgi:hypothetical protein